MSTEAGDEPEQVQGIYACDSANRAERVVAAIDVASGHNVQITVAQKEKIAQGGWASVYRAEINPGKQTIAIKQVKESKMYKVMSVKTRANRSTARWRSCVP